jgi:hypothetical protein
MNVKRLTTADKQALCGTVLNGWLIRDLLGVHPKAIKTLYLAECPDCHEATPRQLQSIRESKSCWECSKRRRSSELVLAKNRARHLAKVEPTPAALSAYSEHLRLCSKHRVDPQDRDYFIWDFMQCPPDLPEVARPVERFAWSSPLTWNHIGIDYDEKRGQK